MCATLARSAPRSSAPWKPRWRKGRSSFVPRGGTATCRCPASRNWRDADRTCKMTNTSSGSRGHTKAALGAVMGLVNGPLGKSPELGRRGNRQERAGPGWYPDRYDRWPQRLRLVVVHQSTARPGAAGAAPADLGHPRPLNLARGASTGVLSRGETNAPQAGQRQSALPSRRGAVVGAPGGGSQRIVDRPPSTGLGRCVPGVDHAVTHSTSRSADTVAANPSVAVCANGAGRQAGHSG